MANNRLFLTSGTTTNVPDQPENDSLKPVPATSTENQLFAKVSVARLKMFNKCVKKQKGMQLQKGSTGVTSIYPTKLPQNLLTSYTIIISYQ